MPKRLPLTGDVTDVDDLNDMFTPYVEELAGQLNEHNWASGAFPRANVADAAAYVMRTVAVTSTETPTWGAVPTGPYEVIDDSAWNVVTGMTRTVADFPGGILWITFSAQHHGQGQGTFYGIRVNGQLVPESVLGSMDLELDLPAASDPLSLYGSTPAVAWAKIPVATEVVIALPPGSYTIEGVARRFPRTGGAGLARNFVLNCELEVLEILK